MGATTSLAETELVVTPGDAASCAVHIRNSGTVVDQFSIDVLGDTRTWAEVEPPVINLLPGQDGTATVHFRPPRKAEVRAGAVPFGVRVLSREDPGGSRVDEGVVHVEPFTDLQIELSPRTSTCRTKARHEVVVDNLSNHPVSVEVLPRDEEDALKFDLDHPVLTVEPGTAAFLKLKASPEDRFLRGPERRHPFGVTAVTSEQPPMTAEGTVVQQQLLPKWLLPALIALLALAIVAVTLWFTVLKPTVQSAAREAAKQAAAEQVQAITDTANQAKQSAGAAEQKAQAAQQQAGDMAAKGQQAGGTPGGTGQVTGPGGVDISKGSSFDFRVAANTPQRPGDTTTYTPFTGTPPAGKTVVVTDLLFQNPAGDGGRLQLKRGNDVLLEVGLNNIRDLDYHLVEPFIFPPGSPPVIAVNCQSASTGSCTPAVSFTGRLSG
ncbi:hypothetical protein [Amycolatopsis anabasis]|uniref:COG1470 family protein n=1 Tax=Amycolatopsis anabasis TaxID=1840409 RepID=UPI00131A783E|nr:hypothetical protein [Amycolatopsis anabasis]